jgi:hypothetical protein
VYQCPKLSNFHLMLTLRYHRSEDRSLEQEYDKHGNDQQSNQSESNLSAHVHLTLSDILNIALELITIEPVDSGIKILRERLQPILRIS